MDEAGYLAFTTAKRADCILSFDLLLTPVLAAIPSPGAALPTFAELVKHPAWAEDLLTTARNHRLRGVTTAMFVGCFKTLIFALEDVLATFDGSASAKNEVALWLRRFSDAYETLLIDDWAHVHQQEAIARLDDANRQLTLSKCKFENILASISDLVFVLDGEGRIAEVNQSALRYLDNPAILHQPIWTVFPFAVADMPSLVRQFSTGHTHQLNDLQHSLCFDLTLMALQQISLASADMYLLVLTDVSAHTQQKARLEKRVAERTADLLHEKKQLEEMNITLKNVLTSIEKQKEEALTSHVRLLKEHVLPTLSRLKNEKGGEARDAYLGILEKQITDACLVVGDETASMLAAGLTPTELRICHMLREGIPSKNIAQAFNLSVETVQTHRKNIRRKLKLHGKNASLFRYLNTPHA